MSNEIVKKEFYDILSAEDIEFLKKFDEYEKRAKVIKDTVKKLAKDFLEKNDLIEEGYEQDGIKLSYKKGYIKKVVDTNAMKEQGIYDEFLKDSEVSPSVSVSIVYDD